MGESARPSRGEGAMKLQSWDRQSQPEEVSRKASQRRQDSSRGSRSMRTVQGQKGGRWRQGEGTVCIQVQSELGVAARAPGAHEEGTGSAEFSEQDGDPESPRELKSLPPYCKQRRGPLRWAPWKDLWGCRMVKEPRGLGPGCRKGCAPVWVSG